MFRLLTSALAILALLGVPTAALAAPKDGCPADASGWYATSPLDAATDFFPHLLPGQFADVAEFAAVIDAGVDFNGDDIICAKPYWGWDLNPNSHWYRVGFESGLGEPVHGLTMLDNHANAQ